MRTFFFTLPANFARSFTGKRLYLHLAAIALTYAIVTSGLDWWWYVHMRGFGFSAYFVPALFLGFFLPILLPLCIIAKGLLMKSQRTLMSGFGLLQASLLGVLLSWFYKAFTGRIPPTHASFIQNATSGFRFGLLRGGVWWGWPSSHATVAFALSVAFAVIYKKHRLISAAMILFAFYVALSVSMSVHWLSEAVAGVLMGTAVGLSVGTYWHRRISR